MLQFLKGSYAFLYETILEKLSSKNTFQIDASIKEYLHFGYPSNHSYRISNNTLIPKAKLKQRYKKIYALYPNPLQDVLDIGCSKGFFIFTAAEYTKPRYCLGVDVYPKAVSVCNYLKEKLHRTNVTFATVPLHELAENIKTWGGPYQTVLVINQYQYLYFGSKDYPKGYLNHEVIFKYLRKVCAQRLIFNNRIQMQDCQRALNVQRFPEARNYTEECILNEASKYFEVTPHGLLGRCPLFTMDVKN